MAEISGVINCFTERACAGCPVVELIGGKEWIVQSLAGDAIERRREQHGGSTYTQQEVQKDGPRVDHEGRIYHLGEVVNRHLDGSCVPIIE